jgi:hypothetical protein
VDKGSSTNQFYGNNFLACSTLPARAANFSLTHQAFVNKKQEVKSVMKEHISNGCTFKPGK